MLFEIVDELVTKEEPLYFNLPNLQASLQNPIPRKEAHQIQKELQQRSTSSIAIPSPISLQQLNQMTWKKSLMTFVILQPWISSTSSSQSPKLNLKISQLH
jgi:hypothetical protein